MKKLFTPGFRRGFAPLLIIGLIAAISFVALVVFGPVELKNLGQLSLRQKGQESSAQTPAAGACNDSKDNDGDGKVDMQDDGCYSGVDASESDDNDNDGFKDKDEQAIGTDTNKACLTSDPGGSPSSTWPLDLVTGSSSYNKVNTQDLNSFASPVRRINTKVGDKNYDKRWDLKPDGRINIMDVNTANVGITANPPMFNGQRAFNGPSCVAYDLKATPSVQKVDFTWTPPTEGDWKLVVADMTASVKPTCDRNTLEAVGVAIVLDGGQLADRYTWEANPPPAGGHKYCSAILTSGGFASPFVEFTLSLFEPPPPQPPPTNNTIIP